MGEFIMDSGGVLSAAPVDRHVKEAAVRSVAWIGRHQDPASTLRVLDALGLLDVARDMRDKS